MSNIKLGLDDNDSIYNDEKVVNEDENEDENGEVCETEEVELDQHIADIITRIYEDGIELCFKENDPAIGQLTRIADNLEKISSSLETMVSKMKI